jgi:2-phospho-L-lactate/phosphoenolpyruvate guanylyltransferase
VEHQAVLVPIKAFADAKVRLAAALPPMERAKLARAMGHQVLMAAAPLPTAVVCDDLDVAEWARQEGAEVVWAPGLGLNGAVEAGVAHLARAGVTQVTVAHGDLPLANDLTWLAGFAGVTLVPDRHHDGTNVACVPTGAGFRFHYGPGSLGIHLAEARRLGLDVRVVEEPRLAWDVDVPDDLSVLRGLR